MSKVKVTKVSIAKTSIKKAPAAKGYTSAKIRPVAGKSHVTTVKPGTLRVVPSNLKTTMKHPGTKTGTGSMKSVKKPR